VPSDDIGRDIADRVGMLYSKIVSAFAKAREFSATCHIERRTRWGELVEVWHVLSDPT